MGAKEPSILRPDGARTFAKETRSAIPRAPSSLPAARAAATSGPTVYVASLWKRLFAAVLDAFIVIPIALLLYFAVAALTGLELPAARLWGIDYWLDHALAGDPALWGALGLCVFVHVLYWVTFQSLTGDTLGMRALKVRVIDVYGQPPGLARSVLRAIGYLLGIASLGLGFLWIGIDRERRGVHDWLAGTFVVDLSRGDRGR